MDTTEKLFIFLQIISDRNRMKILAYLKNGKKCVCEIWENINLSQNLTSYHLKILYDYGLIRSQKKGLKVFYELNKNILQKNLTQLNNYLNIE